MKHQFFIGIDPGVSTGVCIWDHQSKEIIMLQSMKIHDAFEVVKKYYLQHHEAVQVRCEDARKRHWFADSGAEKWQGAGSIKRDCKIWDDFLQALKVDYEMISPSGNLTRLNRNAFGNITGYHKISNQHERAAAMLVYGI